MVRKLAIAVAIASALASCGVDRASGPICQPDYKVGSPEGASYTCSIKPGETGEFDFSLYCATGYGIVDIELNAEDRASSYVCTTETPPPD